jgi:hypothetical protein
MRYMRCGLLIHGTTYYNETVNIEARPIGLIVSVIFPEVRGDSQ